MTGFKALGKDLLDLEKEIKRNFSQEEFFRIFEKAAEVAYKVASNLCPVDTGYMKGQIFLSKAGKQIYLECNCKYAIYNEFGWYGIPPVPNPPQTVKYKGGYRPFMRIGVIEGYRYFTQEIVRKMKK